LSLQRCSRPLCSSQNTGGPSPDSVPTATSFPTCGGSTVGRVLAVNRPEDQACARSPQDPTTCQAPPPPRLRSTADPKTDLYLRHETVPAPNNRCSTLEHLLSDIRTQTRLWIACATSAP